MIRFEESNGQVHGIYTDGDKEIGKCSISVYEDKWTISSWFVDANHQNRGIGKKLLFSTMNYILEKYGEPKSVEYIWNGTNQYVFDWLERNFSPVSKCPLSILKVECADSWDSHIYFLDTKKLLCWLQK